MENIEVLDSDIPAGSTASYKLIGKFPNNNNFPQLNVGSILENGTITTNNGNSSSLGGSNSAAAAILLIEVTSSNNEAPAVKRIFLCSLTPLKMYLQVLYYLHLLLCESIRIQVNVVLQLLKFTNGKS